MTYSDQRNTLIRADDLALMLSYAEHAPAGAFVEVGVYRGGSARELYKIAEAQGRRLLLFDTFAGHPAPSEHDAPQHPEGRYADCADPNELQAEMPNARVIVGPLSKAHVAIKVAPRTIAFAHIDVDLYESTRSAIAAVAPLMSPNGIMYFDDYGVPECPGATRAVNEWCEDNDRPRPECLTPEGKAAVIV